MSRTQLPHQQVKPDPDGVDVKLLRSFAGAVDWATLADLGVLTESSEDARYVQKAGDSVPGSIDFTGQVPTASAAPAGSAGLTNRHYVDLASAAAVTAAEAADIPTSTYDARYAMLASAGAVTGKWDFSAQLPVASTQATGSAQLTNKLYVDTASAAALAAALAADITTSTYDARYVQLASAQAITGVKDFSAALPNASTQPTGSAQLTNKIYVDTASAAALAAAIAADVTTTTYDSRYALKASAAAITGKWDFSAMLPVASTQATGSAQLTNKLYVDTASAAALSAALAADITTSTYDSRYVMLASAQAVTGIKDFSAALPNASTQATGSAQLTNKIYVDTASAAAVAAAIAATISTSTYDSRYVMLASAQAITGVKDFSAALPNASTQATGSAQLTNKIYVDTASAAALTAAKAADIPTSTYDGRYAMLASAGAVTGKWDFSAMLPVASTQATGSAQLTNKIYVDTASAAALAAALAADVTTSTYDSRYVMLASAQAITGIKDFSAALPNASTQATGSAQLTNKIYVDTASAAALTAAKAADIPTSTYDGRYAMLASAGAVTGKWDFSAMLPVASTQATGSAQLTNKIYVDTASAAAVAAAIAATVSTSTYDSRYVMLASAQAITGVKDFSAALPNASTQATGSAQLTNKIYVDTASAAAVAAAIAATVSTSTYDSRYVMLASAQAITGVKDFSAALPNASTQATGSAQLTNKIYVDTASAAALAAAKAADIPTSTYDGRYAMLASAGAVTGKWDFSAMLPVASTQATGSAQLTNKIYVDTASAAALTAAIAADITTATYDARYVELASAQAITGVKDFSAALPNASTQATGSAQLTNKIYVDTASAAALAAAIGADISTSTYDSRYVMLASAQSIVGVKDFSAALPTASTIATASAQFTNKQYVDTAISASAVGFSMSVGDLRYVMLASAQAVTGVKDFSAALPTASTQPSSSAQLTNKQYVDNSLAASGWGISDLRIRNSEYNNGVLATGSLIGFWPLDDINSTAIDLSGNGASGVYSGSYSQNQLSIVDSDASPATAFNPTGLQTGSMDVASITAPTGSFSVDLWVNIIAQGAMEVLHIGPASGTGLLQVDLNIGNALESFGVSVIDGVSVSSPVSTTIAVGKNTHVGFTYQDAIHRWNLFINGVLVSTGPKTLANSLSHLTTVSVARSVNFQESSGSFIASKLAIHNIALTPSQMRERWARGLVVTNSGAILDAGDSFASYLATQDIDGGVASMTFITAKNVDGGAS